MKFKRVNHNQFNIIYSFSKIKTGYKMHPKFISRIRQPKNCSLGVNCFIDFVDAFSVFTLKLTGFILDLLNLCLQIYSEDTSTRIFKDELLTDVTVLLGFLKIHHHTFRVVEDFKAVGCHEVELKIIRIKLKASFSDLPSAHRVI